MPTIIDLNKVQTTGVPKAKPIVFEYYVDPKGVKRAPNNEPKDWNFIELLVKNYMDDNIDLMFAYDEVETRHSGVLHFGQFNDGVV